MSTNNILFGVLFVLVAVAIILLVRIELRLKKLFKGSKAENLEDLMNDVVSHVKSLTETTKDNTSGIKALENRIKKSGRGIKLLRFNPFKDVGGNQSFAVAITNEEGDGVVFSSLYSRERMSVFAKPITAGKSDIELTAEETAVVGDATKNATQ